jgi:hypothetical protein
VTTMRAGSDPRTHCIAASILCALSIATSPAAGQGQETPEAFIEDATGYYSVATVNRSLYEVEVTYEVRFRGDVETLIEVGEDEAGFPKSEKRLIARLRNLQPDAATILACVDDVCQPLETEQSLVGGIETESTTLNAVRFVLADGARAVPKGVDLRLLARRGWVRLEPDGQESPAVSVVLPRLGKADKSVLASRPVLNINVAPIAEDADSDESGSLLAFDGGLHLYRRSHRLGLTYDGTISTDDGLGFGVMHLAGELERNLLAQRGDYLPFKLSIQAESDQSLDLVNGLLRGSLGYVLPWNANFSPRGEGYIPNVGPVIRLVAETGQKIDEDESNPDAAASPERFERAGYELHWRIPIARDSVLTFHHAGLWVFSNELDQDEHHALWDVVLQTRLGNLDYYVGFQQGEAAPLFQATETTQVGVVVRMGKEFQCAKADSSAHWRCERP